MKTVFVRNKEGKPLMPTTRCGHVRILLKEKNMKTDFFDIKVGDLVVCEEMHGDMCCEHTVKITAKEENREFATETNPKGLVFYGDDIDKATWGDDYVAEVNEENFDRIVPPVLFRVGDRCFSEAEVLKALGVNASENEKIVMCVPTSIGEILAIGYGVGNGADPHIDVSVDTRDKDTLPILASMTEVAETLSPKDEEVDMQKEAVRTFLYNREDTYIGYVPLDISPDDEWEKSRENPKIVASGDYDFDVVVVAENQHIKLYGL